MSPCAACPYPSHTQFASPGLVGPIVEEGFDRALDPAWAESGAATVEDYARWCGHLCGATCLRMALGTAAPSLFRLRDDALAFGAYTVDADGDIHGMVYAPAVAYLRAEHGTDAAVHRELTVDGIGGLLDAGRLVVASVHYAIRRPHEPAPGRGGHLVLVTARTPDGSGYHFHNPSGTDAATRTASLPAGRFAEFFAGRGMSLAPPRAAALQA
ncbi:peptidase [Streptomyces sp. NPDC088785]|uniref:peptidase n=1 Tax=Streptomyces sp. NPDC088785 TaxID=3365897 RepID=UPI0037F99C31